MKISTHVSRAEKKLKTQPELYRRISHLRNAKSCNAYNQAKHKLEMAALDFDEWIRTIADFVNV
jgi:hypothetical protein